MRNMGISSSLKEKETKNEHEREMSAEKKNLLFIENMVP